MGRGCPLPIQFRGLGERRELSQWGPGADRTPAENGFIAIYLHRSPMLTAHESKFFTSFKLKSGGTVPQSEKCGTGTPRTP